MAQVWVDAFFWLVFRFELPCREGEAMTNEILIVTNTYDDSPRQVIAELTKAGAHFYRFDTDTCPLKRLLTLSLDDDRLDGGLSDAGGNRLISWNNVKSVWYRRPRTLALQNEALPEGYLRFIEAETSTALWGLWTMLDVFWVNHPIASVLLEHNKLYQQRAARQVGLDTPASLISNEPEQLMRFCEGHGGSIAVKQIRGALLVRESDLQPVFLYTQKLDQDQIRGHMDEVRLAPVFAQEYVPKRLELRVTIVGKNIFSCAIHSQEGEWTKHDWRRYPDLSRLKHEEHTLPQHIEIRLFQLMKLLGLNFGAIDLILTPDDRYVFLEVNPSGQWGWIEELTGMNISGAICDLLMRRE